MPNWFPIQRSFSQGEISPLLYGQTEEPIYQRGVVRMFNALPDSRGPATRRPGFRHIAKVDETSVPVRLVPFDASLSRDYVVVIGDDFVQVFDESGPVVGGEPGNEHVVNGTFNTGIEFWTARPGGGRSGIAWTGSSSQRMLIDSNIDDHPVQSDTIGAYQLLTIPDPTDEHVLRFDAFESEAGSTWEVHIGTTIGGTEILSQVIDIGTDQSITFTPGAGNTSVYLEFWVSTGQGAMEVDNVSVKSNVGAPVEVKFPSPWNGKTLISFIQYALAPGGTPTMYFAHPSVQPQKLSLDLATNVWTFTPVTFTAPPPEWTGESWPRAVTFFQQRSYWGGAPNAPEKFWGSRTGQYENITVGPNADDALEYEIAKHGDILWLSGGKDLVIGTENAEYLAVSDGVVLKTGDVEVTQQSAYGAHFGVHVPIGDKVVFASAVGTKLRNMEYEWTKNAWISLDMAWPSEHLLSLSSISQLAYQFDPGQVIWILTADNRVITCSYDREQNIIGWAQHGGFEPYNPPADPWMPEPVPASRDDEMENRFAGICSTRLLGISRVWLAMNYITASGQRATYLTLADFASTMDLFIEYASPTETNVVPGLDHLEGLTVDVLVDDAVDPSQVVTGGQITTQTAGREFIVGLGNRYYVETLPKEGGNPAGTSQGTMRRDTAIYARIDSSTKPLINGKRPATRTPATPMGKREPLRREDVFVSNLGWDKRTRITVEEILPLYVAVVALFGKEIVEPR